MATTTDATNRSGLDAVLQRQSPAKLGAERPPRELIERLLEAAVRAPNHFLNQPWRFIVLAGRAREEFGEFLAKRAEKQQADPTSTQARAAVDRERKKPLRAPVVIVAAAVRTDNPKALRVEDIAATAAAVQNMQIAAPSLGLGAFWRTGDMAYADDVKAYFGLKPDDDIVSFLYVGYPETMPETPTPRDPAESKTTWRWE